MSRLMLTALASLLVVTLSQGQSLTEALRATAAAKPTFSIEGTLQVNGKNVIIRHGPDASLEVNETDLDIGSLRPLYEGMSVPAKDRRYIINVREGATVTMKYKTVTHKFVLDPAKETPFYIDTEALKVVKLKPNPASAAARPGCNKYVVVFYCKCCNKDKRLECYGLVGCGNEWRDQHCCDE